jgi:hypothetical protein
MVVPDQVCELRQVVRWRRLADQYCAHVNVERNLHFLQFIIYI